MTTGPSGDLPAVLLRLVDELTDLAVGEPEDLVQEEDRTFHRRERLEQNEEGHRERIGRLGVFARIGRLLVGQQRLGEPRTHVPLATHPGRPEMVDRQAGHDRGQVRLRGVDLLARVEGALEPDVGVLDQVLRLAHAADHPVRDRAQQRSELLVGVPLGPSSHRSHLIS